MILKVQPRRFYDEGGNLNTIYGVFIDDKLKIIFRTQEEVDSFIRGLTNEM